MDLRSEYIIVQNLHKLSIECAALLRVSEFLTINELDCPIFADEREELSVMVDCDAIDGVEQEWVLHRVYLLHVMP